MAAIMWKNSLKNVESDNNKMLYEILLDFFLQWNGTYCLNKPRSFLRVLGGVRYCKKKPKMQLVRLIVIRSYKSSVIVTGESRNVAGSSAARLCCSCTVGTELVGWTGTYEYAERLAAIVACVVSFVSALGSHCALISEPVFSRRPLPSV